MNIFRSGFKQILCSAVIYTLVGLFFVLSPKTAFITIGKIIAFVLLTAGIIKTVIFFQTSRYAPYSSAAGGILLVIFGLFMLIRPNMAANIVGSLLGIIIIISGAAKIR